MAPMTPRASTLALAVLLFATSCSFLPSRGISPSDVAVSVFAFPLKATPLESNLTRLEARAQMAIINSLAEMSAKDPAGFLESISSPVFRGGSAQDVQDLSRQKVRLVFSV